MKKKLLPFAVATTLVLSAISPSAIAANVDDDIKELRKEVKKQEDKQAEVQQKLKKNENAQKPVEQDIEKLDKQLSDTEKKLRKLNDDIVVTEEKLDKAERKLKAAEKRVAERDEILSERLRLIYEKGEVSYWEVLLGAKDFNDLLLRFDSLHTIAQQDKELLEAQKRDRDIVAKAKRAVEQNLAKLNTLKAEAKEQRTLLAKQQSKKKVALASLQKEHSNLEKAKEQYAQKARELADELAKKEEEKRQAELPIQAPVPVPSDNGDSGKQPSNGGNPAPPAPNKNDAPPKNTGGKLLWPANGTLTSGYGSRSGGFHKGIDVAGPVGTPIYAAEGGVVTFAGAMQGYGNAIIIAHGGGMSTLYGHMYDNGVYVKAGQRVSRGQTIGGIGNKGWSTGPHVHFEVLINGSAVNPMSYLR
ncbi:murein hydrolase activator EnvC family protein [Numidum massiliense]|uniref:murein hydrolase activator EnvC family protein n=1 Tax=Numidum massiliense TaxID=1522315 RepID=UPI0006D53130|nr:peptidoglycan DD-metalloendopeptidase family protein [Numidum massiliense]